MKILLMFLSFFIFADHALAEYQAGIAIDSSTNMLLRPGGSSGTYTYMYGEVYRSFDKAYISYGIDGGVIEKYEGVQFHHHSLDFSRNIVSKNNFIFSAAIEGDISRYGDVTLLSGYDQYGISSRIKSYITPTILLRWEGALSRRSYKTYLTEDFVEAENYLRIDKFFETRTTIRIQIEAGMRRYTEIANTPSNTLLGFRLRAAQSLTQRLGAGIEVFSINILTSAILENSIQVYDRIFLDDKYKYSKTGIILNTKYLLKQSGYIQLRTALLIRRYNGSQTSSYLYLPVKGWEEQESGAYITFNFDHNLLPKFVNPSFELYYLNVDASEKDLSYDAAGVTLRFNLF